jgi:tetratricopeptide (TPR) repeat protein
VLGPLHRDTLDSLDTYTTSLSGLRRLDEAIALTRECLAARRETLGPEHADTLTSMNNLAFILLQQGEWPEAIQLLRQLLALPPETLPDYERLTRASNLAQALLDMGEVEEAARLIESTLGRLAPKLGPGHGLICRLKGLQVRARVDQGRPGEAIALGREVVATRLRLVPGGGPGVGANLLDVARGLVLLGRYTEAEATLAESVEMLAKHPPEIRFYTPWADSWRGACLAGLGRHTEAEPLLLAAQRKLASEPATPRRYRRQAVEQLVKLYEAWNRPAEATKWRKALAEPGEGSGTSKDR